jgi:spore germination protein KC
MRKFRALLCALLLSLVLTGCWNYQEIDQLDIAAGVALDKLSDGQYEMTVEISQISSGKNSTVKPQLLSSKGKTLFEAARNIILISGRKLYFSHTKVIILSREIAEEGIIKILDWYKRGYETREDVHVLISKEDSAKEILKTKDSAEEGIVSYTLHDILNNQKIVGKTPYNDVLTISIEQATKGVSSVLAAVSKRRDSDKEVLELKGCAVIKDDKLKAFLDAEETFDLLFIRDEIEGGILPAKLKSGDETVAVSFEIFRNKTDVKPIIKNGKIRFEVIVNTTAALAEEIGEHSFIGEQGIKELKLSAESMLKERLEALIKKMQTEHEADTFGFAAKLYEEDPKEYKKASQEWETVFRELEVKVEVNIDIKNTATLAQPGEGGE